jgi:hypothetical protein
MASQYYQLDYVGLLLLLTPLKGSVVTTQPGAGLHTPVLLKRRAATILFPLTIRKAGPARDIRFWLRAI